MNVKLPGLMPDEKVRQDARVVSYVTNCVELCWYMCMQDPPMKLEVPRKGDTMEKTCFLSMGGREGWLIAVFGQLYFYTKTGHLSVKVMFCRKRKRRSRATIHL